MSSMLLAPFACASKFTAICDDEIDCRDGNENDRNACVERWQGREAEANEVDCGDDFRDFFDCFEAEAECEVDAFGVFSNDCSDELEDYNDCLDAEYRF